MAKVTSEQVRMSEALRRDAGESRLTISVWVLTEHKDEAREDAKKAVKKAVEKYQR